MPRSPPPTHGRLKRRPFESAELDGTRPGLGPGPHCRASTGSSVALAPNIGRRTLQRNLRPMTPQRSYHSECRVQYVHYTTLHTLHTLQTCMHVNNQTGSQRCWVCVVYTTLLHCTAISSACADTCVQQVSFSSSFPLLQECSAVRAKKPPHPGQRICDLSDHPSPQAPRSSQGQDSNRRRKGLVSTASRSLDHDTCTKLYSRASAR